MKKWTKAVLCLFLMIASSSCAQNSHPSDSSQGSTTSPSRAAAEEEIAEAVFRRQFEHNASAIQKNAEKYCLSLPGDRMPSAEFLKRFEGNQPARRGRRSVRSKIWKEPLLPHQRLQLA